MKYYGLWTLDQRLQVPSSPLTDTSGPLNSLLLPIYNPLPRVKVSLEEASLKCHAIFLFALTTIFTYLSQSEVTKNTRTYSDEDD